MEVGKNIGRIRDYGISATKAGKAQVFVQVVFTNGEEATWYGYPLKNDGELNESFMRQLCYAGFDPSKNNLQDLQFGKDSEALDTTSDIDFYAREERAPNGDMQIRLNSIGPFGPARVSSEAIKELIPQTLEDKIKSLAGRFEVRSRSPKPSDSIPF